MSSDYNHDEDMEENKGLTKLNIETYYVSDSGVIMRHFGSPHFLTIGQRNLHEQKRVIWRAGYLDVVNEDDYDDFDFVPFWDRKLNTVCMLFCPAPTREWILKHSPSEEDEEEEDYDDSRDFTPFLVDFFYVDEDETYKVSRGTAHLVWLEHIRGVYKEHKSIKCVYRKDWVGNDLPPPAHVPDDVEECFYQNDEGKAFLFYDDEKDEHRTEARTDQKLWKIFQDALNNKRAQKEYKFELLEMFKKIRADYPLAQASFSCSM